MMNKLLQLTTGQGSVSAESGRVGAMSRGPCREALQLTLSL
jgi:hypothetical protein